MAQTTFTIEMMVSHNQFDRDVRGMISQLNTLSAAAIGVETALNAVRVGGMVGIGAVAGLVAPTILASKAMANFDTTMRRAAALGGPRFQSGLSSLQKEVSRLASTFGVAAEDIAAGVVELTKAGFLFDEISGDMLEGIARLALVNQEAFETVASTVTYAYQLWGGPKGKAPLELMEKMHVAANMAVIDINDLGSAFQYAGSSFKIAGVSFEEFLSVMAALSQVAYRSSQTVGTLFNRILLHGEKLEKILGVSRGSILSEGKISVEALISALSELENKHEATTQVAELWGVRSVAAFNALMNVTGEASEILAVLRGETDELRTSSDYLAGSFENLWGQIMETIYAPFREKTVLDAMRTSLEILKKALADEEIKKGLASIILLSAKYTAIAGPKLIETLSKFLDLAVELYPTITEIANGFVQLVHTLTKVPAFLIKIAGLFIIMRKILPTKDITAFMSSFGIMVARNIEAEEELIKELEKVMKEIRDLRNETQKPAVIKADSTEVTKAINEERELINVHNQLISLTMKPVRLKIMPDRDREALEFQEAQNRIGSSARMFGINQPWAKSLLDVELLDKETKENIKSYFESVDVTTSLGYYGVETAKLRGLIDVLSDYQSIAGTSLNAFRQDLLKMKEPLSQQSEFVNKYALSLDELNLSLDYLNENFAKKFPGVFKAPGFDYEKYFTGYWAPGYLNQNARRVWGLDLSKDGSREIFPDKKISLSTMDEYRLRAEQYKYLGMWPNEEHMSMEMIREFFPAGGNIFKSGTTPGGLRQSIPPSIPTYSIEDWVDMLTSAKLGFPTMPKEQLDIYLWAKLNKDQLQNYYAMPSGGPGAIRKMMPGGTTYRPLALSDFDYLAERKKDLFLTGPEKAIPGGEWEREFLRMRETQRIEGAQSVIDNRLRSLGLRPGEAIGKPTGAGYPFGEDRLIEISGKISIGQELQRRKRELMELEDKYKDVNTSQNLMIGDLDNIVKKETEYSNAMSDASYELDHALITISPFEQTIGKFDKTFDSFTTTIDDTGESFNQFSSSFSTDMITLTKTFSDATKNLRGTTDTMTYIKAQQPGKVSGVGATAKPSAVPVTPATSVTQDPIVAAAISANQDIIQRVEDQISVLEKQREALGISEDAFKALTDDITRNKNALLQLRNANEANNSSIRSTVSLGKLSEKFWGTNLTSAQKNTLAMAKYNAKVQAASIVFGMLSASMMGFAMSDAPIWQRALAMVGAGFMMLAQQIAVVNFQMKALGHSANITMWARTVPIVGLAIGLASTAYLMLEEEKRAKAEKAALEDELATISSATGGSVPRLQTGGEILEEGYAYLHEGETVISEDDSALVASALHGKIGGGGDIDLTTELDKMIDLLEDQLKMEERTLRSLEKLEMLADNVGHEDYAGRLEDQREAVEKLREEIKEAYGTNAEELEMFQGALELTDAFANPEEGVSYTTGLSSLEAMKEAYPDSFTRYTRQGNVLAAESPDFPGAVLLPGNPPNVEFNEPYSAEDYPIPVDQRRNPILSTVLGSVGNVLDAVGIGGDDEGGGNYYDNSINNFYVVEGTDLEKYLTQKGSKTRL